MCSENAGVLREVHHVPVISVSNDKLAQEVARLEAEDSWANESDSDGT